MNNFKFSYLVVAFLLFSCSNFVKETPIENIFEHRTYIRENLTYNKDDLYSEYETLFKENDSLKNSPFIYYYLSRVEDDKSYLKEGLLKFPDDPYLRLVDIYLNPKKNTNEVISYSSFIGLSHEQRLEYLGLKPNSIQNLDELRKEIFFEKKFKVLQKKIVYLVSLMKFQNQD